MNIDWTEPEDSGDFPQAKEGMHRFKVTDAEVKKSKKGDGMVMLTLFSKDAQTQLCKDFIMLEGAGRWFGQQKLRALGFDESTQAVASSDFVGREGYVYVSRTREGTGKFAGKFFLEVDKNVDNTYCGYLPADTVLQGRDSKGVSDLPGGAADFLEADDTPF